MWTLQVIQGKKIIITMQNETEKIIIRLGDEIKKGILSVLERSAAQKPHQFINNWTHGEDTVGVKHRFRDSAMHTNTV